MGRGGVSTIMVVVGALVVSCCANRGGHAKNEVQATVGADFSVAPDPLHLSIVAQQQAVWTLRDAKGPLAVEAKEGWPIKVSCPSSTRCMGTLSRDAKPGRYAYRVLIAGKPGPDPMVIIDP